MFLMYLRSYLDKCVIIVLVISIYNNVDTYICMYTCINRLIFVNISTCHLKQKSVLLLMLMHH